MTTERRRLVYDASRPHRPELTVRQRRQLQRMYEREVNRAMGLLEWSQPPAAKVL